MTQDLIGSDPLRHGQAGAMAWQVHSDRDAMGRAAAADIALQMAMVLARQPRLRMILAAAPSQSDMLARLIASPGIDWARVELFHMDEFIGLPAGAPQRFGNWLDRQVFCHLPQAQVHRLDPGADPEAAAAHYAAELDLAPIDVVCLGIGVNGHIAFNDPPVADFSDPLDVKLVELDETCRRQQLDDQGFDGIHAVPPHALTLTIPRLLRAERLFCVVPGAHKAPAVAAAVTGPRDTACPASVLRDHPGCRLYLDRDAAALI